jgi:hypothetical protein
MVSYPSESADDEIVGKGGLCRGNDLVRRGIGPAIGDIVANRFIE